MKSFDLDQALKEWRKKLAKLEHLEPAHIEELESHLLDKMDAFISEGLDKEQAFENAAKIIPGEPESVANEFKRGRKRALINDRGISLGLLLPSYIKITLRQLYKQKGHSVISIFGMSVGIACCILILMFVKHELSFDTYHANADNIYRLTNMNERSGRDGIAKVNGPWGPTAKENIPEVKDVTRFVPAGRTLLTRGEDENYESWGLFTDPSFFTVFSYELVEGDMRTALDNPQSIVLTRQVADVYFPNESPIGKSITLDGNTEYTVTGLLENPPTNTHLPFRFLLSMTSLTNPDKDDWIRWNQFYTYLLLEENASPEVVAQKFDDLLPTYVEQERLSIYNAGLQPIKDIHLKSDLFREIQPNSSTTYVYAFAGIALLILLIACVNFTILSTARAMNRGKEVGVRKSSGAQKSTLLTQFLGESITYTFISALIALGIAALVLPNFNQIAAQTFEIADLFGFELITGLFVLIIAVGVLAGSYPAFLLSGFKPIESLKGEITVSGGNMIRSGLVVLQFSIAAGLILATTIVIQQLDFMQNKNLGFDKEQLVVVPITDPSMNSRGDFIKQELLRNPSISKVSISANFPGGTDYGIPSQPVGIPEESRPQMRILAVDHEFISTFGMNIIEGRDFSRDVSTDAFGSVIINQEAARQLGWENPLNEAIAIEGIEFGPAPVIGVLEDFHYRSLREPISPILLFLPPSNWYSYITVRISPDNVDETIEFMTEKWAEFDPANPFSYVFFDRYYQSLYSQEQNTQSMLNQATLLAILISVIGLFGLASFIAEKRTKEIGIRKVLGASTTNIVLLMGKQFTILVAISLFIALPLAYLGMGEWLRSFAYQTSINSTAFLITIASAFAIAWLSVSYQSIKAALSNPVKSLRSE